MNVLVIAAAGALGVLSCRRLVFLWAAVRGSERKRSPAGRPTVSVVVPAHNEEDVVDELLAALERLEYRDGLSFVFVCDGCTDATPAHFRTWAAPRNNARVLVLGERVGKPAALNAALAIAPGEIIVTLDADLRPRPTFVSELIDAFDNDDVAAAAAFIEPVNADDNVITRYSALNAFVHQLITSAAKEKLGLNPPTSGASAYRAQALAEIGGFSTAAVGDDVEASVALTRHGGRTRFIRRAVVENRVVDRLDSYWRQHVRWTRATLGAGARRSSVPTPSLPRTAESWMLMLGNGDRAVVLVTLALGLTNSIPLALPLGYLGFRAVDAIAALVKARKLRRAPEFAFAAVAMFPVDVAASVAGLVAPIVARSTHWQPRRSRRHTAA